MKINSRGNITSRIWVVMEEAYNNDKPKGFLMSGAYGWHFDKILQEAGLPYYEVFITCLKPDDSLQYDDEIAVQEFAAEVDKYRPPFIIVLGTKTTGLLLPQTRSFKKPFKPRVESFAGSLLQSNWFKHEHYCITTHPPDHIIGDWKYRDIQVNLDFGRLRAEYEYWKTNNCLQPLPTYDIISSPTSETILKLFSEFAKAPALSQDIETIRPTKSCTSFTGNPGFPYLMGIADSPTRALSYSFWNYDEFTLVRLWRAYEELCNTVPLIIGQNFFNFDSNYLFRAGFSFDQFISKVSDTLIRQHILWPELKKSLQFMTKQYTRQPYYKDEGKGFVPKNQKILEKYMHYNALDACVTYEVWKGQEDEFKSRPYLI